MELLFTPLVDPPCKPPRTKTVTVTEHIETCDMCHAHPSHASIASVFLTSPVIAAKTVTVEPSMLTERAAKTVGPACEYKTEGHHSSIVTVTVPSAAASLCACSSNLVEPTPSTKTVTLYARSLRGNTVQASNNVVYVSAAQDHGNEVVYSSDSYAANNEPTIVYVSQPVDSDYVAQESYLMPEKVSCQSCRCNVPPSDDNVVTKPSQSIVTVTVSPSSIPTTNPCKCSSDITTQTSSSNSGSSIPVSTQTVTVSVPCNCSATCSGSNDTTNNGTSSTVTSSITTPSCIVPTGTVCVPLETLIKYNVSLVKPDDIPADVVFTSTRDEPTTLTVAQVCNGTTSVISTVTSTSVTPTSDNSNTTQPSCATVTSTESPQSTASTTCASATSTVTQTILTTVYPDEPTIAPNTTASSTSTSTSCVCSSTGSTGTSNTSTSSVTTKTLPYCNLTTATTNPGPMIIVTNAAGQPVSRMNITVSQPVECNSYLVISWDQSTLPSNAKYLDFYLRNGRDGKPVKILSDYSVDSKVPNEPDHVLTNSVALSLWQDDGSNLPDLPAGSNYIVQVRAKNGSTDQQGLDLAVGWSHIFSIPKCGSSGSNPVQPSGSACACNSQKDQTVTTSYGCATLQKKKASKTATVTIPPVTVQTVTVLQTK
jgi:hypothetical protein